ncbi:response regulator transcription factor [Sulfurimonas paralvinellae]|uniref:Response regulator transcription factor n=1 Tax=Sulfurimonas paralvinellae TaxID=317658 RepID=A0A7M1B4Z0_9BACT|nr:response regulator transcription factor [Sulfurimonas paralvinellae]QOP44799.1 response regulator transcription factor [Sulfurimonas paralvinellae]
MQKKILLLEDDYELAETLQELLEASDYGVDMVHTGNDAIDASYENSYDLYVFDINVPDISGIELLESLREADDKTPTIFISALVDLNTIAKGFEVGADDYIKKPFFPEELLIRVKAKLTHVSRDIEYKNLRYSPRNKELFIDGHIVSLGEVQECLCDIFMQNIGNVIDKSILMDCLTQPSDSALRVALNKFKHITDLPIKNVRGVGYILEKS